MDEYKIRDQIMFGGPKVTGEQIIGVEYEQDETGYQERRKHVHNYLHDPQMPNEPVAMEMNSIMDASCHSKRSFFSVVRHATEAFDDSSPLAVAPCNTGAAFSRRVPPRGSCDATLFLRGPVAARHTAAAPTWLGVR